MNAPENTNAVFRTGTGGEILRHARESGGLSQKDVANRINLLVSHVRAIDDDRYDALIEGANFKECIQAYADLVGLDQHKVWNLYMAQIPEPATILEQPEPLVSRAYSLRTKIVAGTLTGVCMAFGLWMFYSATTQPDPADSKTTLVTDSSTKSAPTAAPETAANTPPTAGTKDIQFGASLQAHNARRETAKIAEPKAEPEPQPKVISRPSISELFYAPRTNIPFNATMARVATDAESTTVYSDNVNQKPAHRIAVHRTAARVTEKPGAATAAGHAQPADDGGQQFSVTKFSAAKLNTVSNKVADFTTQMMQFAKAVTPYITPVITAFVDDIKADYEYRTIPADEMPEALAKSDIASLEQQRSAPVNHAAGGRAGSVGAEIESASTDDTEQQEPEEVDVWEMSDVEVMDKYLYSSGE